MKTHRRGPGPHLVVALVGVSLQACGGMADSAGRYSPEPEPGEDDGRVIEESDLYKLEGDWLYVQNPTSGLNVIDVSSPDEPRLHRRIAEVRGNAGELYVREDRVYVLFKGTNDRCGVPPELAGVWTGVGLRSEVMVVISAPAEPKLAGSYCLPGDLVASRVVGRILYVVTSSGESSPRTGLFSLEVEDPENPAMADMWLLPGGTSEVHVTEEAIYLAEDLGGETLVKYVDISDPGGVMVERGSIRVTGAPQGRFHMNAYGTMFRIVTFSGVTAGSNLHVIDASDPDRLVLMGSLTRIGNGEELWATRFVEDRAYVVTYERWRPSPGGGRWVWGFDPLWVISLEDPYAPEILGELEIPGWSVFLYPIGDRIVAVGRGDRGRRVAASLFDVSDPSSPRQLERLEFGADESTSEANTDFRGVSIVEIGEVPLVTVPYTVNSWDGRTCTPEHRLQLIDLESDDLGLRDAWTPSGPQQGLIRRTVAIGRDLYVISDRVVAALDVSDRSDPWARVSIDVAGDSFVDECTSLDFEIDPPRDDDVFSLLPFGCSVVPAAVCGPPLAVILALLALCVVRSSSRRPRG